MSEETHQDQPSGNDSNTVTISRDELDRIIQERLDERDREHAEELAAVRSTLPSAMVPANGGGPGTDNHQVSWNLAEQEAAARGETLDTWT